MTETTTAGQDWNRWLTDPLALGGAALEYAVDAWQRGLLYADVRRERGNQYREHLQEKVPHVLGFAAELVMSGLDLPRPVNYGLVRVTPPEGMTPEPGKRPFVVVDPRAGHGPGIGGFKPDSEIGAAFKAGHPCYFVGFTPDPVPGQTVEDVMRAEAAFVRKVAELHPDSRGKPAVIGNCQAGWQVLMAAAVWPELFGPIIVAGAPLSYWAGDNPMRYAGGLLGGSWLTALTGDVGAGRWDGAWLVQNFENLDPANTLWSKNYNLYSKVDTEAERYLGFEKYWGGHVFLDAGEMQYIADNLFIGNKLATAGLTTSDGVRIDLRNIRSPIVVFCSYGDNITPPPQALGWITDLYRDDADVAGHDQTIVYATHDSIGHLGIFVSSSVGRKEHREFAANIDVIDLLPAGIYCAEVDERPEGVPEAELTDASYLMRIRRSGVEEVRGIVRPDPESERRFAAAARISQSNLALYRNLAQPWVRALSTEYGARWLQALHPMRTGYEGWSDRHPLAPLVADAAERVRGSRRPVAADNPFLQAQASWSDAIEALLDHYRDHRDAIYAAMFDTLYGWPAVQALAGMSVHDQSPPRRHPGDSPEHRRWLTEALAGLREDLDRGGLPEAVIRAIFYAMRARGESDGRHFRHAAQLLQRHLGRGQSFDPDAFRQQVRRQALLLRLDAPAAVAAIPGLLARSPADEIRRAAAAVASVVERGGALSAQEQEQLRQVLALFAQAVPDASTAASGLPAAKVAPSTPVPQPSRTASRKTVAPKREAGAKAAPRKTRRGGPRGR
ncbi:DUF3141 domain-containing protein [Xanthomonas hortorum]|uniref:DUF3141 domain-containing protein n=1 Tax=Xanthomonas hortorum TaxID=56454 RepID=UPI000CEEFB24|nr:DUF3141 domain-containing protein [Xanthomonas hortorum]MCE4369643.1 DUF3141 domain-containing protein [Xanthomonas hortorum pv. hederae]PPU86186.1 3-hydroxyalkanoate synthetase [Xanthomonas hortorum pv. hederae]PUF01250.1 DUF3141 domain-containing protein [Xanthomonas hortorum pv. hederae]